MRNQDIAITIVRLALPSIILTSIIALTVCFHHFRDFDPVKSCREPAVVRQCDFPETKRVSDERCRVDDQEIAICRDSVEMPVACENGYDSIALGNG